MTSDIQVAVETLRSVAKAARTVKQNLGGPAVRIDLGKSAAEAFWAAIDTVTQHLTAQQAEAQAVAVVGPGGYPNWLISWLESPAYRTLPQGTKLYTLPTTQAVGVPRGMVESIVRSVAELPDRNSPEEWPEAMLVTADELASIVTAALAPAVGGEVWVNRCPYNHSRNVFCPSCVRTRPPGAVHGMPVQPEPISEGVQSRLEALRTTNWNLHSPQDLADTVASTIEAALATSKPTIEDPDNGQ